jgi:hypothetical protein
VTASTDDLGDLFVEGVGEADVADYSSFEERKRPDPFGAINDLIRNHEISRLDLLSQASDGRKGDHTSHTETPQSGDVGTVRDLVRGELVVEAVAREEGDGGVVVLEDGDGGGGGTPGCLYVELGDGDEAFEGLEAGAAYDGYVDGT